MTTPIQKPALMRTLLDHADQRGWVDIDQFQLGRLTGIPDHDVVHALWDLQKRNFIKFRERHVAGGSQLVSLRLTSAGRSAITATLQRPEEDALASAEEVLFTADPAVQYEQAAVTEAVAPEVRFPETVALSRRSRLLEDAAALAEQAGADDLAIALMEKAHTFTPLEHEAIALLRMAFGDIDAMR
jgi:hypothetical protein